MELLNRINRKNNHEVFGNFNAVTTGWNAKNWSLVEHSSAV